MYIQSDDRPSGYAEDPMTGVGMAPVIAVEAGGAAAIIAIIEAIAFVASAAAAAYLLIKAYEAAQARGFGIALAKAALTAGLRPMINMGKRMAALAKAFFQSAAEWARKRPDCQRALFEAMRAIAELEKILLQMEAELQLPVPRADLLRRMLTEMKDLAIKTKDLWMAFKNLCGPGIGPGPIPA
jgi:hypothetical protein